MSRIQKIATAEKQTEENFELSVLVNQGVSVSTSNYATALQTLEQEIKHTASLESAFINKVIRDSEGHIISSVRVVEFNNIEEKEVTLWQLEQGDYTTELHGGVSLADVPEKISGVGFGAKYCYEIWKGSELVNVVYSDIEPI